MLNSLRKNPVTKEVFSSTYKTLAKRWVKDPVHDNIFQEALLIDFNKKEPSFILSDSIVQILKLILHITEYKIIIWLISSQGKQICKQALLELDLIDKFNLLYWLDPVEAMGMNFKEGILITNYQMWPLLINKLNIKAIVIQERINKMPTYLEPIPREKTEQIEWIECQNYLETAKEIVTDLDLPEEKILQIIVSNLTEQRKMKKILHNFNCKILLKPTYADITIDIGKAYYQEYNYNLRAYTYEKRIIYQNQFMERVNKTAEKYYLLISSNDTLPTRIYQNTNMYAETLQLLGKYSPNRVRLLLTKYYNENMVKHIFKSLYYLEAIDSRGHLTILGQKMHQLPIDPQISRLIIKYGEFMPCVFYLGAALDLSSDLSDWFMGDSPNHQQWEDSLGDHLSLLSLIQAFCNQPDCQAQGWCLQNQVNYENLNNCVKNAQILANRLGLPLNSEKHYEVREAILDSFYLQTLVLENSELKVIGGKKSLLESKFIPDNISECMVCSKIIIYKRTSIQLMATPCTLEELAELVPKYFNKKRFPNYF